MTNESRRSYGVSQWRGLKLCASLLLATLPWGWSKSVLAQEVQRFVQEGRKVKFSVQPEYPELARRNNIKGITRLEVEVSADGSVKNIKVLGGNPVLVQASVDAVKKWKYEAASGESTALVKFEFKP